MILMRYSGLILFSLVAPFAPDNAWKFIVVLVAGFLLIWADYTGHTSLDWPVYVLLGIVLLTAFTSISPFHSFIPTRMRGDGIVIWIAYGLAGLQCARLPYHLARWLLIGLLAVGTVQALLAVGQTVGAIPNISANAVPYNGHGYGTLGNVMFFSGTMAALLPVAISAWLPGSTLMMLYGLFVANERVVWVGIAVAFGLIIYRRALSTYWLLALAPMLLIFASRRILSQGLPWRDMLPRLWAWQQTLHLILVRPWGWGLNSLMLINPADKSVYDNPHNELLYVAFSFGVAGLVAYLWIWWTAVRSLWYARSREATGVLAGLIAFGIWAQTNWSHIGTANILWTLLGLSVPISKGYSDSHIVGRMVDDGPVHGLAS